MSTDALPGVPAADSAALLARVPFGRLAATRGAMPFVVPTRHVVAAGALLVRLHAGLGYHRSCHGAVVAYEAEGDSPQEELSSWTVQCIGTARIVHPADDLGLFGPGPALVDGEPFVPVVLRIEPEISSVHRWSQPAGAHDGDDVKARSGHYAASTII
jgi:hypothetical protein